MDPQELDWIVQKASELLVDKVREAPITEGDIKLAFDIFAEPRLKKIASSFESEEEYTEAVNYVRVKLHEVAQKLNSENWPEG